MKKLLSCAMILVFGLTLAGCGKTATTPDGTTASAGTEALAQCLTDKGMKMFGTEWCSHCKNQKSKFGDAFSKVSYIDCDAQKDLCTNAGIQGYPTWIDAQGKQYPGDQALEQLATIAGCPMTQ